MDLTKFSEYGLLGLFMGVVLFILFKMIVWVMAFVKEQSDCHSKERTTWLEIITAMKQSIDSHNMNSNELRTNIQEAHKFQREEHQIMIGNLKEITTTLGRINGYKKE